MHHAIGAYLARKGPVLLALLGGALTAASCAPGAPEPPPPVLASYDAGRASVRLTITYPFDGSVFPPEIAPPTFRWTDPSPAEVWLVAVRFRDGGPPILGRTHRPQWTPDTERWNAIKRRSREALARAIVVGASTSAPAEAVSAAEIHIATSADNVGAPIFYRDVNLPFIDAVKDPSRIAWRLGSVASAERPPVVLSNLPVCGNCHSFSADGRVLGMDVDYANDKGSYALTPVGRDIVLDNRTIITWSDYQRDDGRSTFGLLSQVSPDGRYAISTVKDRSVFIPMPDLAYSQLFFPIRGILAFYDRRTRTFASVPGADDPTFCQSNPTWTADGRGVVFARAPAHHLKHTRDTDKVLLTAEECREFVTGGEVFQYDLYRVPFNGGTGGRAEPLPGAAEDGVSEYFPKFSPDGRWVVFCKAFSFMLLQPDSALHIMPADGGRPRRMRCNLSNMNSWHSWSPNSRWLVFSSKHFSPYTQLFLAHVDADGRSSPPVLLEHFTAADRAANIPEFVHPGSGPIATIREAFVDDVSFVRAAQEFLQAGDDERAADACRKALAINPHNTTAHNRLGAIRQHQSRLAEAVRHYHRALEADPDHATAHANLAGVLLKMGHAHEAVQHYRAALRVEPDDARVHLNLGGVLLGAGRTREAARHLTEAVRLRPDHADSHYNLAQAYGRLGDIDKAIAHYREAVRLHPDDAAALTNLGLCLSDAHRHREGLAYLAKAVRCNPGLRTHLAYAELLAAVGQYAAAIEEYREARVCDAEATEPAVGLAWVLAAAPDPAVRNGAEAVRLAKAAVATEPEPSARSLDALAAAYAACGCFDEAALRAARAFVAARREGLAALARQIAARHRLYRDGKPFRLASPRPPASAPPSSAP